MKSPWINIKEESMPLEIFVLAKHKHGIEAIVFYDAAWRFWYRGDVVETETLKSITHWLNPKDLC